MARRESRQCNEVKSDGSRCGAYPISGSDYCFAHDPARAAERQAARQSGGRVGKTKVLSPETPDAPLLSMADVVALLGLTINQVRRGELDPRVANAVGYLAATLLRALEQGDIEKRLAELEAIIKGQGLPETLFDVDLDEETVGSEPVLGRTS